MWYNINNNCDIIIVFYIVFEYHLNCSVKFTLLFPGWIILLLCNYLCLSFLKVLNKLNVGGRNWVYSCCRAVQRSDVHRITKISRASRQRLLFILHHWQGRIYIEARWGGRLRAPHLGAPTKILQLIFKIILILVI